jgi:hypothetical protein
VSFLGSWIVFNNGHPQAGEIPRSVFKLLENSDLIIFNLIISSDPFAQITFNAIANCLRPVGRPYLSRFAPKTSKNPRGGTLPRVFPLAF